MSEGKKFLDCIVTFKPSDDSGDIDVPLTISTEEHSEQILLRVVHKAHLDYRKQYNFNYTEWQEEDEFPGETENSPGEDQVTYEIKDNDGMKGALKDWERSSLKRKAMIVTRETNAIIAELSKEPRDKMTRNGLRTMKTLYSISLSPYNIQFIPVTLLKTLEATAKNGNDTAKSITLAILRELVDNPAMTEAIARAKTLVRTIFFVTKNRIKEIRQMRENMSENQRREVVFLEETLAGFAARLSLNPMGRQALARFKVYQCGGCVAMRIRFVGHKVMPLIVVICCIFDKCTFPDGHDNIVINKNPPPTKISITSCCLFIVFEYGSRNIQSTRSAGSTKYPNTSSLFYCFVHSK